jgi:surfeit locus 1 family protein
MMMRVYTEEIWFGLIEGVKVTAVRDVVPHTCVIADSFDAFTRSLHSHCFGCFPLLSRRNLTMHNSDLALLRSILSVPKRTSIRWRPRACFRRHVTTSSSPRPNADSPDFVSILDAPPKLISTRRKTTKLGVLTLALIPFTAFCLGSWQVQRLDWKTKLIAKFEDRLVRDPLPLPPRIDPQVISEFDYRRVYATGTFQHDKEMLVGPRMHDGKDGFFVITPLYRGKGASTVLINRGWISREMQFQRDRVSSALPSEQVTVSGLLREPWKRNMFTPTNKPDEAKFYFPDVHEMAEVAGAEPVWIEETMQPNLLQSYAREARGIPIGRPAEVNLRNNHTQYIFTW